ncbi:MAG TPA: hypothetical protein VMT76_09150 [Puia sp.]|nr:hypothetical protein [Puia sp.]
MRIIIILSFFLIAINSFAQDADYNDFRRKNEGFMHIYDKSIRSDLSCFTIAGIEESMGKGKLKEIPVKEYGNDFITFDSNDIRVTIKAGPFFVTKHKLTKEGDHLVKIDNRPFYGNYGKTPATSIAKVFVLAGKDTVDIPETAYRDLYNPGFTYPDANGIRRTKDAVYLSPDKHTFYIYMLNKDDNGSYEVTWIIQDKKFLKRVLDWGFTK